MAGSGTTLVTARMKGHNAIGFDSDPMAVLLSSVWTTTVEPEKLEAKAAEILTQARRVVGSHYPETADNETRDFIRYWFDQTNRVQLTALSISISRIREKAVRNIMWCAFSRMIITKKLGVSLAMDVSHSRPHKKYEKAPIQAFDHFPRAVTQLLKSAPFLKGMSNQPPAIIQKADARDLPLRRDTVDVVITSPPYLNAIDYLRGHKLSLVWMGYSVSELRNLRSKNIGSAVGTKADDDSIEKVMKKMCDIPSLSASNAGMLRRYVKDTRAILTEIHRVLKPRGKAVIVVGDCNIRDVFVKNSQGIKLLGEETGLKLQNTRRRPIPENRRYLPPPTASSAGKRLQKRMREEVILTFIKSRNKQ
ncbi:MAG: class I SAM-dependent methyltransferase [Phycisphaerales bacterium]|nr:class I SAM-dependent methyltransferase [Phycisphaerales bacterium]